MRIIALLALLPLIAACRSPAPPPPQATIAPERISELVAGLPETLAARRQAGAEVYRLLPERSQLRIYVFRGGKAPKRGKNHVLSLPRFSGYVALESDLPSSAEVALGFAVSDLDVDPPALREETGGSFAKPLDEEAIAGTRRNMLGESVLDAERHPHVLLRSTRIEGDWPYVVATIAVSLHGATHEYPALVHVQREDGLLRATGSLVIRQSDFGITPMSVLGGLIGLQDPLGLRFTLVGERLAAP